MNTSPFGRILAVVAFLLAASLSATALDDALILAQSDSNFSTQSWFSSGRDNHLDTDKLDSYRSKGYYVTGASYGPRGWFVIVSKTSEYTGQVYKYAESWPSSWIDSRWDQGYRLTQAVRALGRWFVVMTKGTGYGAQRWSGCDDIDEFNKFVAEGWDKDYYITSVSSYNSNKWMVVMSKTNKFKFQSWFTRNSYDGFVSSVRELCWDKGNCMQIVASTPGVHLLVYCKYASGFKPAQSYKAFTGSPSEFISGCWDKGKDIVWIGGNGRTSASSSSSSYTTTTARSTGRLPSSGEAVRMQARNGALAYVMLSAYTLPDGQTAYSIYPDDSPYGTIYRYKHDDNSDGQFVLRRYKLTFGAWGKAQLTGPLPYEIHVSHADGTITLPNGQVYDKLITKDEADRIAAQQRQFINAAQSAGGYVGPAPSSAGSSSSSSTRSSSGSAYTTCRVCGGSRTCTSCHGTGGEWRSTGYYVGTNEKTWIPCPSCNGSKRCFNCHGTGRQ